MVWRERVPEGPYFTNFMFFCPSERGTRNGGKGLSSHKWGCAIWALGTWIWGLSIWKNISGNEQEMGLCRPHPYILFPSQLLGWQEDVSNNEHRWKLWVCSRRGLCADWGWVVLGQWLYEVWWAVVWGINLGIPWTYSPQFPVLKLIPCRLFFGVQVFDFLFLLVLFLLPLATFGQFLWCGVLVPPPLWISQPYCFYRSRKCSLVGLCPQPKPPSSYSRALSIRTVHIVPTVWSKNLSEENIVNVTGCVWEILVDLDHWIGFSSHLRR